MASYLNDYEGGYYSGEDKSSAPRMGYGGDPTRYGPGVNDWTWAYGSPFNYQQKMQYGGRSSGGRSYSGGSGSSRTTVQSTRFTMPRPELPTLPTLEMPKVDKRAVAALAQKAAAPGIRSLREQVQTAMGQTYENPNVRRMTLREALQGYGAGLEKVMSGAQAQGRAEHMQDLQLQATERQANWKSQTEAAMESYNKAWAEYLASAEKTTQTDSSEDSGVGSGDTKAWFGNNTMQMVYTPEYYERRRQNAALKAQAMWG